MTLLHRQSQSEQAGLCVWVLTDGKIGDDVQCLAVAAGLSESFEKRVIAPRAPWSWLAPWGPIDPRDNPDQPDSPLKGPVPDVIVVSGRRAVPYACAIRKRSGGEAKVVILKDPRLRRSAADVIWAPAHDRAQGRNIFSTLTSPHALTAKMVEQHDKTSPTIAHLPKPILGVVLGGPGGGARYGAREATALAVQLNKASVDFGAIAVTPSRRTPREFVSALENELRHAHYFVWHGEGENPYLDILANAEALVVGADSHNMLSEAVASQIGVYAYRPPGLAQKLDWFVSQLEAQGVVRPFNGAVEPFHNASIDATPEIIAEIKKRLFGAIS